MRATQGHAFVLRICDSVARPKDYRWSSYRATAGVDEAPEWLDLEAALNLFAPDPKIARAYYREFVLAKIDCTERLGDELIHGIYLGIEAWAKKMRKVVESSRARRTIRCVSAPLPVRRLPR